MHIYPPGTTVGVTATPNSGYYFSHWILDGANAGNSNPINVLMDQNHTLNAVFLLTEAPPPPPPPGVGGIIVPVDKFALFAPYIGLTSTIIVAAVATVVYVKRVRKGSAK
jgi:hypothetical protein